MAGRLRVLIAPDCFGDSLTAAQAAEAIASGWRRARAGDDLVLLPLSDGGPGFVAALTVGQPAVEVRTTRVSGPLAESVDARWAFDPATATAYIESAQACGLALLGGPPTVHTAIAAHSRGVGQLIEASVGAGARTVVVGLGGSACTDGITRVRPARSGAMKNGFSRGSCQQAKASRPLFRIALRKLVNDATGSAKNITPKREASRSKLSRANG
jgi:glycerate kinase